MSKVKVSKIETYEEGLNSHCTNRSDVWNIVNDREFDTMEEAREYVIEQNRKLTDFIICSRTLTDIEKEQFAIDFSFGDRHCHMCRYFIGKPPKSKIASLLNKDGIKVIK